MKKKYSVFDTAWGYVAAVWSADGLWELTFPHPAPEDALAALRAADVAGEERGERAAALGRELQQYFTGQLQDFAVTVDWGDYTPFQAAVLRYTAAIPYGAVAGYGQVAAAIGFPRAARAVGGALHINRTPVVVPCHRVIAANGQLGGFGGGLERKRALLALEADDSAGRC